MLISHKDSDANIMSIFSKIPKELNERAENLLNFVGLYQKRKLRAGDLSFGQQKLLELAMALMNEPEMLLLDEPTEGIQPSIILDIERAVQRIINETGISVLLVEQHLHFVKQSSFYYAMQRGGIVSSGPTSSLSDAVIQEFLTV